MKNRSHNARFLLFFLSQFELEALKKFFMSLNVMFFSHLSVNV